MRNSKHLLTLTAKIKKHCSAIAKERDGLRKLQDEIEDVLEPTNRGVEALEEAIAALSEQN